MHFYGFLLLLVRSSIVIAEFLDFSLFSLACFHSQQLSFIYMSKLSMTRDQQQFPVYMKPSLCSEDVDSLLEAGDANAVVTASCYGKRSFYCGALIEV